MELNSSEHFQRLELSLQAEIDFYKRSIDQRCSEKIEYEELQKRVGELPKKLAHEVMIPCGSMGYMPAKIVNTNELTILLGENYFVKKSAHQATEIIQRRLNVVNDSVKELETKRNQIEDRLSFLKQYFSQVNNDEVEIREEYNEEEEKLFRQKRLALKTAKEPSQQQSSTAIKALEDEEYMKQLDALEAKEATNDELKVDELTHRPPPGVDQKSYDELIKRIDEMNESSDEDEDYTDNSEDIHDAEIDSDDLNEEAEKLESSKHNRQEKGKKLGVRFSNILEAGPSCESEEVIEKHEVKPILKNKSPTPVDRSKVGELEREATKPITILPSSKLAFPGEIVEHDTPNFPAKSTKETSSEQIQPKRTSKFKQMRSN